MITWRANARDFSQFSLKRFSFGLDCLDVDANSSFQLHCHIFLDLFTIDTLVSPKIFGCASSPARVPATNKNT